MSQNKGKEMAALACKALEDKKAVDIKVIDIEKTLQNYENGTNTSIGKSTYSTLQDELSKIRNIVGENIEF